MGSCFALALTIEQRTVFWVVFEGFWLRVILRRARRNLDSDSKEKSSMVKAVDCRLFESKNNFDERATMSAIHGEGEKEKEPKLDKASKASKASKPDEKRKEEKRRDKKEKDKKDKKDKDKDAPAPMAKIGKEKTA